jgi:ornithine--oxo-acid transaminase
MNRLIRKELQFGANNYKSLPVCLSKGRGIYLFDTNNKKYFDFLSCYSAVNQGHCHPKIIASLKDQADKLTLTSRAYFNDQLGPYMEFITNFFNYDKVLPMNTGVEAGETAIKIARKWGYESKGVENNKATVLFAKNNFWGRTISACSSSNDPDCYTNFGPFMDGMETIDYNCIESLEQKLNENKNIVAFMLEPIQGEAGVIIPENGYLKNVKEICKKHNVLMICDEVQSGIGRTGKMLASDHEEIKPDILCLGKALSGGVLPISAVLADDNIMKHITPGTHGSTFGGNPLASVVATASLEVIRDENLCDNSNRMGQIFRNEINLLNKDFIKEVRGKGLMNAIEFENKEITDKVCIDLLDKGLLTKSTHDNILRMSPPLIIKEEELLDALELIKSSLNKV